MCFNICVAQAVHIVGNLQPTFNPSVKEVSQMKRMNSDRLSNVSNRCFAIFLVAVLMASALLMLGASRASYSLGAVDARDLGTLQNQAFYSREAILVRRSDGSIMFEKNANEAIYPASLTKMMTVLVAIENIGSASDMVYLPEQIFAPLNKQNASMAGLSAGEYMSAGDLLYCSMLPSGADASVGLAIHIAGSEAGFVKLMNEKAAALGMTDTNFENVTGLHDRAHVSTASDMAVLLSYALNNQAFREVFTTSSYTTAPTNKHKEGLTVRSTLFKRMSGGEGAEYIVGGKTGYTSAAGLCLASLAQIDGEEYIFVSAGAEGDSSTPQYNIEDALTAYAAVAAQ